MLQVKNFKQELESITDHWSPKVVGQINDQFVKVAKLKGEFCWHKHDDEDEMFYIVKGNLLIQYENEPDVRLYEGDFHIVPKGIMHNPVAEEECWIVLVEPAATKHTGDVITDKTKSIEDQMADA